MRRVGCPRATICGWSSAPARAAAPCRWACALARPCASRSPRSLVPTSLDVFVRCPRKVRELPRLIERKAAADVAASLKDGRWAAQQARMRAHSARAHGGAATLEYILEAEISREAHSCPRCAHVTDAAARGVGGCHTQGWPTRSAAWGLERQPGRGPLSAW